MHPVRNFPPYFSTSILISSSHLRLGLTNILFRSGFPTKILYAFLISPIPFPSHPPLLITLISGEAYKLWSSLLCSLLQPPAIFSFLGPNYSLQHPFNTLNLCSSPSLREQVSHPYETTGNMVSYTSIRLAIYVNCTSLSKLEANCRFLVANVVILHSRNKTYFNKSCIFL